MYPASEKSRYPASTAALCAVKMFPAAAVNLSSVRLSQPLYAATSAATAVALEYVVLLWRFGLAETSAAVGIVPSGRRIVVDTAAFVLDSTHLVLLAIGSLEKMT